MKSIKKASLKKFILIVFFFLKTKKLKEIKFNLYLLK